MKKAKFIYSLRHFFIPFQVSCFFLFIFLAVFFLFSNRAQATPPYQVLAYVDQTTEAPTNSVTDTGQGAAINWTTDIPWNDITMVADAFMKPVTNDTFTNGGAKGVSLIDAAHAQGKRCIVSIGGSDQDKAFKTLCSTSADIAAFASAVTNLLYTDNYDGADIDWETVVTGEQADATTMMEVLYADIKALPPSSVDGKLRTLSFTTNPSYSTIYNMTTLASYSDWCLFMGYDWYDTPTTYANGPLNGVNPSIVSSITGMTNGSQWSYPMSKMILGCPLYTNDYNADGGDGMEFDTLSILLLGTAGAYNTSYAEQEYTAPDGDTVYVDTAQSFCDKINWANSVTMMGIGLWDMGQALPSTNSAVTGIWNTIGGNSACLTMLGSTATPTGTETNTPMLTDTNTPTGTPTLTATLTSTVTETQTRTPTNTLTNTPTSTLTMTLTPTDTLSPTLTNTSIQSPTFSTTVSETLTLTSTLTPTSTLSATFSPTVTSTGTQSPTLSPTVTSTLTQTSVFTDTSTITHTFSPTLTNTGSPLPALSPTVTPTLTLTPTSTATSTFALTSTPSASSTVTPTVTSTITNTIVLTQTPTGTDTITPTDTETLISTPTLTDTWTFVNTATWTWTPTNTGTPTVALIPCPDLPVWSSSEVVYEAGQDVGYNGERYQCIEANTSDSQRTPPSQPALWKDMGPCGTTATPTGINGNPVIYPNPSTTGEVTLQLPISNGNNVEVKIFTIAFREVFTFKAEQVVGNSLSIPLTDKEGQPLANGLYYFVIQINGTRWINKELVLR